MQRAFLLLTLLLLAIGLPAVTKGQGDARLYEARRPSATRHALGLPPSNVAVHTLPETDAKVRALIAEVIEPEAKMELTVHQSKILRTKSPVTRVSITSPKTLEVVQFTPTEFELIGLKAGQTSLTFWFGDNQSLRYQVVVNPSTETQDRVARRYNELEQKINEMFPNSLVQLIPIADKLIIRGQARDSEEAAQIIAVLSGQGRLRRRDSDTSFEGTEGGMVDLGPAMDPDAGPDAGEVPPHNIINLMDVPGEQQIMLKVRIAELDRTAARRLSTQFRINSGILALNTDSGGLSAVFSSVMNAEDLRLAITAVSSTGYTKIHAEPNLIALNGQTASMHAGGKFAVPTAVGIGGVSGINTQFQSFGTSLTFTPTIIDKDRIRLKVNPSFSAVAKDITVQGIPGTSNRSVHTEVDLRVGQWLAIGGLIEDNQQGSKINVPFVGDIPVLGAAFGKRSVSRHQTEMIVLVSPELVHPMDARETPMILPGMEIGEPGDVSFFLGGAYVAKYEGVQRRCPPRGMACPSVRETMSRPDFQRSEKYYIYGEHGISR